MTVNIQEGFGVFCANGPILNAMSPGSFTIPDWNVQYVFCNGLPIRLRSMALFPLALLSGGTAPGSITTSYFVAVGPAPQNAVVAAVGPVPPSLFTNLTPPFHPTYEQFINAGFVCMEAGVMGANPWIRRKWSEKEITISEGQELIVAACSPYQSGGGPLENTQLIMNINGQDDNAIEFYQKRYESSLARYGVAIA